MPLAIPNVHKEKIIKILFDTVTALIAMDDTFPTIIVSQIFKIFPVKDCNIIGSASAINSNINFLLLFLFRFIYFFIFIGLYLYSFFKFLKKRVTFKVIFFDCYRGTNILKQHYSKQRCQLWKNIYIKL